MALENLELRAPKTCLRKRRPRYVLGKTRTRGATRSSPPGCIQRSSIGCRWSPIFGTPSNHDEFEVYYQPIIDHSSGTTGGVEALIRWNHPERGLVMPDDFIGVAESSGIIVQIGEWILRHACQEFVALTRDVAGGETLGLSVNLSARQLRDPTLFDTVRSAAARLVWMQSASRLRLPKAQSWRMSRRRFAFLRALEVSV